MLQAQNHDLDLARQALERLDLGPQGRSLRLNQVYLGRSYGLYSVSLQPGLAYLKRALPQAGTDSRDPYARVRCERNFHLACRSVRPGRTPRVFGLDRQSGILVLERLDAMGYRPWTLDLTEGMVDLVAANDVGRRLGGLHAQTARREELAEGLTEAGEFRALYLARQLEFAGMYLPDMAGTLSGLASMVMQNRLCLVHGRLEPDWCCWARRGPVFMGGDLAWFGDPAWNLAHLLSRLMFLSLGRRWAAENLLEGMAELSRAYMELVDWEPGPGLQARAVRLTGGLLLCGVKGSLSLTGPGDDGAKARVSGLALELLRQKDCDLAGLQAQWARVLGI